MNVYKISKKWRYFLITTTPAIISLLIWAICTVFQNDANSLTGNIIFAAFVSVLIIFIIVTTYEAIKSKLIFQEDSIIYISAFHQKELLLRDILGYRIDENKIILETINQKIRIFKYTENYDDIVADITQNYLNLDVVSAYLEKSNLLNDNSLGNTQEIREAKLQQAKRAVKILNIASFVSIAWIFFYPHPYQYAFIYSAIIPIAAILVLRYYNGLIRIDEKKGSDLPYITYALIFPSSGMALRALFDYNIVNYSNIWMAAILLTVAMTLLLYFRQKEFSFKKGYDYFILLMVSLFFLAYSFSLIILTNCLYDNTLPKIYTVKILDKRISKGRVDTYYLKLDKWGKQKKEEEAKVSYSLFSDVDTGDQIKVVYRYGKLDIPWFFVEKYVQ